MSSQNPFNPYVTPHPEAGVPTAWSEVQGLEYTQSVKFVFENPNWLANILFVLLCILVGGFIPILPALVLIGYQCELLESLLVRPQQTYPDFKFDRIMDYLVRGIWPFIVALLAGLIVIPLMILVLAGPIIAMIVLANAAGRDGVAVVVWVMVPIMIGLTFLTAVLCNIATIPFMLRAALTQDIGASFDLQFARDFVRRMWKETILAGLFLIVVALAAQILGLLMLCIGIFFTIPIVQFTQTHMGMQLYRLYLARGGEKIPLKSASPFATA